MVQASSADAEAVAAASRRACAVAHPITERQGMLFVWGEGGLEAEAESRRVPPPVCPLTEETRSQGEGWAGHPGMAGVWLLWRCCTLS